MKKTSGLTLKQLAMMVWLVLFCSLISFVSPPLLTPVSADSVQPSIAAGGYHTIALQSDGTLYTWGLNNYGQLGTGDTTNRYTPTQIGSDNDWVAIAAGYTHTIARKSDGTLWAWGYNYYGQLGDGTSTDRYTPTQISFPITATAAGNGSGSISSSPAGISYSYPATSTGSANFYLGATVTLTAIADTGSTVSWTTCNGTTSGNGTTTATCTFNSLDDARTAQATFNTNLVYLPLIRK